MTRRSALLTGLQAPGRPGRRAGGGGLRHHGAQAAPPAGPAPRCRIPIAPRRRAGPARATPSSTPSWTQARDHRAGARASRAGDLRQRHGRASRPFPSIAAMNANQPEFSKPVWSYLDSAVSARRIKDAQVHAGALWRCAGPHRSAQRGAEGNPGRGLGHGKRLRRRRPAAINLFAALATLAYDGPRADYARPEFFAALQIYQEQHYPLSEMTRELGGRVRPDPVHPHHLSEICRRWRWRWPDRSVAVSAPDALASAAQLLARPGLEARPALGL